MNAGQGRDVRNSRAWLLPAAAALVGVLLSLLAWLALLDVQRETAVRAAKAELETAVRSASVSLEERLEALRRLARRWERQGGRSPAEFELEAEVLRESYPSFRAVGWVGPDRRVRWVFPRAGNEAALGLDVNAEPNRAAAYQRAASAGGAFTPPLKLVQGGTGILAIVPVRTGVDAGSFAYAAIDPAMLLGNELRLASPGDRLLIEGNDAPVLLLGDRKDGPTVSGGFELGGVRWEVALTATAPGGSVPHLVFALGVALSAMLGLALRGRALAATASAEAGEAASALARSEAQHRAVVDTAVDAIVVIDSRGTVRAVNPACERMFGYAAGEVVGRNVAILMPEAHARAHDRHLERYAKTGERRIIGIGRELEGRRKDGTTFPFEAAVGEWEAEGERLFAGILRDVTERRRAEREVAEAARFLQAVVDGALDPIFVKDKEGRMLLANEATASVFGASPETVVGRCDADFLPPEAAAALAATDTRVIETGEPAVVEETIGQDGVARVFLSAKTPLRDASGTIVGLIGVARDVTDRKAAEEEVRRLNADLEERVEERTRQLAEAAEELRSFAHSVAHDLRAPLRSMSGFSQALLEDHADSMDEEARDYARRIADGAARLDLLIQDLLAYAKLGRQEVPLGPVPLARAVAEALAQVETAVRERGTEVEVEGPLPAVRAHRGVLVQVVANLVSNAVKFVPPDRRPRVRIRAERSAGRVRLWVEDNGVGVAPEHRERIFRVFERLHGMAEYPGTGIGLAIVRRGAERMGGSAGVEPGPGEGSRFWVKLEEAGDGG